MTSRIYLDWNATAPLCEQAKAAVAAAMDVAGNPSSVHGEGRAARQIIEKARESVAALTGAEPKNVVFTSGGTEANVLALTPQITDGNDTRIRESLLISAIEHPSVGAGGRFKPEQIQTFAVDARGVADLSDLQAKIAPLQAAGKGFLVSLMHANNETGVIQPVEQAAEIVHAAGGLLHVDAVQSAGKISCDIKALGADLMTVTAHKIGGPQGAGALIKARQSLALAPLLAGGGQERGARAGTENAIGIAGFGAAAAEALTNLPSYRAHAGALRDALEAALRALAPETVVFGAGLDTAQTATRLPNTTLFALRGIKAETALIAMDLAGFAISSGSACSSGKVSASHVLRAMGVTDELAACALRLSVGPATTRAGIDAFLQAWSKHVANLSNKEKRGIAA
jgi:cysteine desulfurase